MDQQQPTSSTKSSQTTSNQTEQARVKSVTQLNNINSKNSCGFSPTTTSQTQTSNHLPFISLSKLKNYMPQQNQVAATQLFQCSSSASPLKQYRKTGAGVAAVTSMANVAYYRGSGLDKSNQSSCKLKSVSREVAE